MGLDGRTGQHRSNACRRYARATNGVRGVHGPHHYGFAPDVVSFGQLWMGRLQSPPRVVAENAGMRVNARGTLADVEILKQ